VVSVTKAQVQVIKVGYQGPCVVLATTTGSSLRVKSGSHRWLSPTRALRAGEAGGGGTQEGGMSALQAQYRGAEL
jgi:hypothetical protein